jgi:CRISPR/Cas system CSM-associated protein Csm3 (group 7 of RAMP superfamily)
MSEPINRWLLTGHLVLRSPVAVRSGDTATIRFAGDDRDVQCARLEVGVRDLPCVPGTSLKGTLRAWLRGRLGGAHRGTAAAPSLLERVFGHEPREIEGDPERLGGRGGKAEFHDALLVEEDSAAGEACQAQIVVSRAAIDCRTRAAARRLLAHAHAVPAGRRFAVTITSDGLEADEVTLLLAALEGFNSDLPEGLGGDAIRLGAGTGSGQGRVTWEPTALRCMDCDAIARWFAEPTVRNWRTWLDGLPATDPTRLDLDSWRSRAIRQFAARGRRPALALRLRLDFSGPFAVGDPSRRSDADGAPDLEPRVDEHGRALLPGSSVKGVLRAQAERSWRTVHGTLDDPATAGACRYRNPIEWRFGTTGWKGVLEVSDFREPPGGASDDRGRPVEQEFVAIDRFTGGVAGDKKFKARLFEAPLLEGELVLRPRGDGDAQHLRPALGLMALVLRDLVEGDLAFGQGVTNGMGACTASIVEMRADAAEACAPLHALLALRGDGQAAAAPLVLPTTDEAAQLAGPIIRHCLEAFRGTGVVTGG